MTRDTIEKPREVGVAKPAGGDIRRARPLAPLRSLLRRVASVVALVTLALTGLALGLYAALAVRELYYGKTPLWGLLWEPMRQWLPFLTLITVLVFWQAGLYADRERRAGVGRILSSLILVAALTLAFAIGSGYQGFNTFGLAPTAVALSALCIGVLRASYDVVTRDVFRLAGVRRRAVLVGEGDQVGELRRALGAGRAGIDYEFLGVVSHVDNEIGLPVLGDLEALPRILASHNVDELILVEANFDERQLLEIADQAHRCGVRVRIAPTTTELLTERAEYVPGHGFPLFELRPPVLAGADWATKRAFDLVVSVAVVVIGAPFWLVVAAAVKLTSPGPVFFRDRRVGLNEEEFLMVKFRTMRAGASDLQPGLEGANEATGALFKIRDDPRVTPVGRFLRRFSLDEIPNVINVLRGEMSLVGPRPLPVRDYLQLEPWHRKRYLVLPGMSGLWQIAGRSDLSFDDLVRLDFYYLENWSLWLDISILAKTIPAVLTRRGAY